MVSTEVVAVELEPDGHQCLMDYDLCSAAWRCSTCGHRYTIEESIVATKVVSHRA